MKYIHIHIYIILKTSKGINNNMNDSYTFTLQLKKSHMFSKIKGRPSAPLSTCTPLHPGEALS